MNIQKTTRYLALALLISVPIAQHASEVVLETSTIAAVGINGETIALMKQYDGQLLNELIGKRDASGKRVGLYEYQGKIHTILELVAIEQRDGQNDELRAILKQARKNFENMSTKFRAVAQGTKKFMSILIEESCKKRNRINSILNIWGSTDQAKEEELFDVHVLNLGNLATFHTDLHNFLNDLMNSCPKAQRQFKEKVAKFNKIKNFLPSLGITKEEEQHFLKQINVALGELSLDSITQPTVRKLFNEYKNTK